MPISIMINKVIPYLILKKDAWLRHVASWDHPAAPPSHLGSSHRLTMRFDSIILKVHFKAAEGDGAMETR